MLIHIDSSAVEALVRGGPSSDKTLCCMENLLRAHDSCKHIVSLVVQDIHALEPLAERFSGPARAALSNISGRRREISGFRKEIAYHLELGLGPAFQGAALAEAGRQVIRADLHHFEDFERASRAVLLAEHLTDADLYEALGKAFTAAKGWQAEVVYEKRGGGGSALARAFAQVVQDGRIALAIADSDQRHPRGGQGDTAAALRKVECAYGFHHAHVLHVRAAENLLPFEVYEEALAPHAASPSLPERLMALDRAVPRTKRLWRAHADLKAGLRWRDVQAMPAGDAEQFWTDVSRQAQRDRCRDPEQCRAAGECGCYVVEGLGPSALARAVAWIGRQRPERLAKSLAGDPELEALSGKLASWGCALPRRLRA